MRRFLMVSMLLMWALGCGLPQYAVKPSEAKNSVSFSKTPMGDVQVAATVGADTKSTIKGLEFKTANGSSGKVDEVTFEATPSNSLTAQVAAMETYNSQLGSYYKGLADVATANWTGFAQAISAAAPIAAPFLQGMAQAKLAKAQRPGLIEQLSGLVMSGQTSTAAMKEIDVPADILAAVDQRVDQRIAELKASQAATTQKSEADHPPADAGGG